MNYSFNEFLDSIEFFIGSRAPESLNPKYQATIDALAKMLDARKIPYTRQQIFDGEQLRFPWCDGDVVCHVGSYGSNNSQVESMGFPWDDGDVTKLSIEEAADLITNFYPGE